MKQLPEEIKTSAGTAHPPPQVSVPPSFRKSENLFDEIKSRDLMLHHPYDSFDAYLRFIQTAAEDPEVVSLQQTVYRTTSGPTDDRTTWTRLVPSGTSLWVIRLTARA